MADASTGAVREVLEETTPTFFESGNGRINWRYLPASNEVIWFSERDNWGQLYLYDLATGKLKQQITTGDGNVTQLLRVDEKNRMLYFQAVGKRAGRDPYFTQFYRIGMDGKNLQLLTPERHEPRDLPVRRRRVLRRQLLHAGHAGDRRAARRDRHDGDAAREGGHLEAHRGRLEATDADHREGARRQDGSLRPACIKPTALDPSKKYPIINHIYPGPQTGSVGGRSFSAARGDSQALAELGFIVVEIDGMGTPWRSKTFHEAYYGDMGDNTLPDQVTGMKELAAKYPYIDIDRAGIWGHSGGGFATAAAMFRYPDFFKVGIAESGNHDNRVYEDDWAEKWTGLLEKKPDGTSNYDSQANQNFAKNLKGKLLLAHGTLDNNVPPNNTLLVVDALIKANKDFDLIMLPNQAHGYASMGNYMMRRRWDYFVKNLLGAEPPKEYAIGARRGTSGRAFRPA